MLESILDSIRTTHHEILSKISEYNSNIAHGDCLEHKNTLEVEIYFNFLASHIINLLMDDESLYLPDDLISVLSTNDEQIKKFVEWQVSDSGYSIKVGSIMEKEDLCDKFVTTCFDMKAKNFIQEICAQDIVHDGKLAKKISSILTSISGAIVLACKGEDVFWNYLSTMREGGKPQETVILKKYNYEYRNRGALIRNRVFKHKYLGRKITENIVLESGSDELIDYRADRNFCQAALLHVGVESTGSCGTGFVISEDGYALTCAHVVEGAKKEIYATVINGDGYPIDDSEGFEVYDAGDGEVVYVNKELDIALLKMHHGGCGFLPVERRKILPELGEEVVVFGYPLGYEVPQSNFFGPNISFYKGYVSSNQIKDGNSITYLDIDFKSGNSGSPVISTKTGKVIGIISGIKVGGQRELTEKMPYMIPIQHFLELMK